MVHLPIKTLNRPRSQIKLRKFTFEPANQFNNLAGSNFLHFHESNRSYAERNGGPADMLPAYVSLTFYIFIYIYRPTVGT